MVLDELKRVSYDRDTYKEQLDDAEKRAREAWDEVTGLREAKVAGTTNTDQSQTHTATSTFQRSPAEGLRKEQTPSETAKSTPTSAKSPTGSIPSLSIFSPKPKPIESPVAQEVREDLFSYDDEIPRLQSEVKDRDNRIEELQSEVTNLQGDLSVTRESTQSRSQLFASCEHTYLTNVGMVQTLEEATRELSSLRDYRDRSAAELEEQRIYSEKLRADLSTAEAKVQGLQEVAESGDTARLRELVDQLNQANCELEKLSKRAEKSDDQDGEIHVLQEKIICLQKELSKAHAEKEQSEKKADTAASLMKTLRDQLAATEAKHAELSQSSEEMKQNLDGRILELTQHVERQQNLQDPEMGVSSKTTSSIDASQARDEPTEQGAGTATASKKKNKKKKKGGKGEQAKEAQPTQDELATLVTSKVYPAISERADEITALKNELQQCRQQLEEKDAALDTMRSKLRDQDDLKEEIESLRDDLINVGQGYVQAKDRVKELQAEKQALESTVAGLEKELAELQGLHASNTATSNRKHQDLAVQFEELKSRATSLQTDLSAAQQLASSRFKELSDLRTVMQKAQPELASLRNEVNELKSIKEAHDKKDMELKRMESRQEDMRTDITTQKRVIAERDTEIENINQKLGQERSNRARAEDARNRANEEVQRLETEKKQASESLDKLSRDLSKARGETSGLRSRLQEVEQRFTALERDKEGLKEETDLKTAQYASAQSLMSSMRDQTTEMAVQMKEARDRCESLEEEVADAHRLLSERSREGETMRRLLADVEGKTDARIREMKDRMDTAIEERDRAEDEASTAARRRARELDDLGNKVREAERSLKRAEDDKEGLETAQRDWKRRREELEHRFEQSAREAEEVRRAMGELRDALDESERQLRDAEKQKAALRRGMEDTQHRLERLQKSNKVRL